MTPKRPHRSAAALLSALALAACAADRPSSPQATAAVGPEVRAMASGLAPAERPARPLSTSMTVLDLTTGRDLRLEATPLGRDGVEVRDVDGCVWRRFGDWFAPSSWWRSCGDAASWRDGEAVVEGGEGLWPLRPGAEGRFHRRAVSAAGRSYERDTVCRVGAPVEVLREGRAPTPAHVVACDDGKRTRTTWWAPDEGPVAFVQVHEGKGVEDAWVKR